MFAAAESIVIAADSPLVMENEISPQIASFVENPVSYYLVTASLPTWYFTLESAGTVIELKAGSMQGFLTVSEKSLLAERASDVPVRVTV